MFGNNDFKPPLLPIIETPDKRNHNGTLRFPTMPYMQIHAFAIQCHLDNLIATYGREAVETHIKLVFGPGFVAEEPRKG